MLVSRQQVATHYLIFSSTASAKLLADKSGYFLYEQGKWNGTNLLELLVRAFGAKVTKTGTDGKPYEVYIKELPPTDQLEVAALSHSDMSRIEAGGSLLKRASEYAAVLAGVAVVFAVLFKVAGVI